MIKLVKEIRAQTGAGVVDIKKALDEASGDKEKAIKILRKRGLEKAVKKESREASEGFLGSYVHMDGKMGVFVKLLCETDFVARNEEFRDLARDLAMHIAAMDPQAVNKEDVSDELVADHKEFWIEEVKGKPEDIIKKILKGKEDKFRSEKALLSQSFVKNPELTVEEVIKDKIAKMGENIKVEDFVRFQL